jgi:hypothetical protein
MKVELRLRGKMFVEIPVTEVKCLRDVKKCKPTQLVRIENGSYAEGTKCVFSK